MLGHVLQIFTLACTIYTYNTSSIIISTCTKFTSLQQILQKIITKKKNKSLRLKTVEVSTNVGVQHRQRH